MPSINDEQIISILKIVNAFDDLNQPEFFKYVLNIVSEIDNKKITVLTEIIINHNLLGLDKTFEYIALVKNADKIEYKMVLESLKKEFINLNITSQLNNKKMIFKLGRK